MVLIYALAFTALAIIIDQVRVFVIKRIKIKDRIDKAIDGILGLIKWFIHFCAFRYADRYCC